MKKNFLLHRKQEIHNYYKLITTILIGCLIVDLVSALVQMDLI